MAFRRVGGYLYVVSLLVNMEGALKQPPKRFPENGKRNDLKIFSCV